MIRIFASLAVIALFLLAVDLVLGLMIGDYNERAGELVVANRSVYGPGAEPTAAARAELAKAAERFEPVRARATSHRMVGIVAALVTVLVNSISVTYFIGTSRWCREVVDAYGFDQDLWRRSHRLKRKAFPWSFLGILLILTISAIAAAGDPGITGQPSPQWVLPHVITSIVGTLFIACAFFMQIHYMAHNSALIDEIVAQVQIKRGEPLQ